MSQFIEMFGNPVANNRNWPILPIAKVAPEKPSKNRQSGKVWILNLDMIESDTGKVINKIYDNDTNLVSVAPFDEGNILFSKLRPYLNKVVIPNDKGYATTELVPLRPDISKLNLIFLSNLLRSDSFVNYANSISSGTKMPRMPLTDLRKFECILPPITMQKEFAAIVEQADKSKFIGFKSQFIELISRSAEWKSLNEITTYIGKGITPKYVDHSNIAVINQACVYWTGLQPEHVKFHDVSVVLKKAYLEDLDILLNSTGRGTLGRSCLFVNPKDGRLYITDGHVSVIKVDRNIILPEVLVAYFSLTDVQNEIYRQYVTGSTNQIDIVFSEIRKMIVPIPNIEEQKQFIEIAKQADKSKYIN